MIQVTMIEDGPPLAAEAPVAKLRQALYIVALARDLIVDGPTYTEQYDRRMINEFNERMDALLAGSACLLREVHRAMADS